MVPRHLHRLRKSSAAARIAAAISRAVAALHAEGIVHGNLVPGNVVLDASSQIHLLDFHSYLKKLLHKFQLGREK